MPELDIEVVHLEPGEHREAGRAGAECAIVVLGGTCTVTAGHHRFAGIGERADVFDGDASAVYLPAGSRGEIEAHPSAGCRAAVITADAAADSRSFEPFAVTPTDLVTEVRGSGASRRRVVDIIGPGHRANRLLVGETFSDGGIWSSYPPHRHDRHEPPDEHRLQEAFLIRLAPATGFAVMVHYPDERIPETATVLHDGEVARVAEGYHSFAAAAGHQLYYLWALAGDVRELRFRTDPRHAWLLSPEAAR